jgi:hypothetical protein
VEAFPDIEPGIGGGAGRHRRWEEVSRRIDRIAEAEIEAFDLVLGGILRITPFAMLRRLRQ